MALTKDNIRLAAERLHQAEKARRRTRWGRPLRPLDADLRWIGGVCYRNGQLDETGLTAGVLNHPATSVAWLANKIAPNGLALEPGQVVLAGSFIRPIETRKGETIQADYGPYGSVSC
jgi:2-oxo-hept-3-ene-1,7-dioate hydratase